MNRTEMIAKMGADLARRFPNATLDIIAETIDYTVSFLTDAELLGANYDELVHDIAMDAAFISEFNIA